MTAARPRWSRQTSAKCCAPCVGTQRRLEIITCRSEAQRALSLKSTVALRAYCSISSESLMFSPGSPPVQSLFLRRNQQTCESLFGRLLPSSLSFLSSSSLLRWFVRSFRSLGQSTPPLHHQTIRSTMGPRMAIVCVPGSPSAIERTKVPLPLLLGDRARFIVRLRSVTIDWLTKQRNKSHTCACHRGDGCAELRAHNDQSGDRL